MELAFMEQYMKNVNEKYDTINKKLTHIEYRAMNLNIHAHEAVRQICITLSSFKPEADPGWALREIRDTSINYLRALSKYNGMRSEEKGALVRMMLFEAAKRHVWSNDGDQAAIEKYKVTVELCQKIEETTLDTWPCAEPEPLLTPKLFDTLTLETVRSGYAASPDYYWLRQNGSLEGKYEMQTVVRERDDVVQERTEKIPRDHGYEPDPKRQKTEPQATASTEPQPMRTD